MKQQKKPKSHIYIHINKYVKSISDKRVNSLKTERKNINTPPLRSTFHDKRILLEKKYCWKEKIYNKEHV